MSEWYTGKLGEILELKRGYDLPSRLRINGEVPVISSGGFSDYHAEAKVKGPGVVTGRYGTIGKVFFVNEDYWPLNTTLYVKNFKGNHPKFIYYFLKLIDFQSCSDKAAVPGLNRNHLHLLRSTIPPLPEQQAIAHILGTLDDKIELNRKMNQTLESMAQALFKSWFVDFDPVMDNALAAGNDIPEELQAMAEKRRVIASGAKQSHRLIDTNPELAAKFPSSFVLNETLGKWIPEGWEVKSLGHVTSELRRGISPKYVEDDGVRVLNQKCIRNHEIDYSLARKNDTGKKSVEGRYLEPRDMVVNSTGTGTLGRVANVLSLDEPTVVDSHVTVIRANEDMILKNYFNAHMFSIENIIEKMGEGSTGQTELSRLRLSELTVLVPPLKIQSIVDKQLSNIYDRKDVNSKESTTLTELRDRLLPKLINGKVRVKQYL